MKKQLFDLCLESWPAEYVCGWLWKISLPIAPEQKVEATATPAVTEAPKSDVVEMKTATDDTANIKNVMGTKSETTTSIVFTNKMGSTISAIYVRPTRDDGDDSDETWGSDLVNSKFTLADNDKAVYYMEKDQKDDNGDTATSFDVRITFSDEEQNECFFRQLPLTAISQISLCMDGEGEDGIPYATYLTSGSHQGGFHFEGCEGKTWNRG